jgi:uncharacterized protein with NRDE domain
MCLLVLAWRSHPRYRLVIAANRDEFHARPAAALGPWNDAPGIVGGRDLQAGGAWFAIDQDRRCGIVTNFREFGRRRRSAPSRGGLIPSYLGTGETPAEYLRGLETDAPGYSGFNLLLADRDSLWYASNRADQFARELPPGNYGLSNEFLDTPWPKLVRVRARFEAILADPASKDPKSLASGLFDMLDDRETAAPDSLAPSDLSPEWARKLSSPFVLDSTFGTRCSTVMTISSDDSLHIAERRFEADGIPTGETEYALNAGIA